MDSSQAVKKAKRYGAYWTKEGHPAPTVGLDEEQCAWVVRGVKSRPSKSRRCGTSKECVKEMKMEFVVDARTKKMISRRKTNTWGPKAG